MEPEKAFYVPAYQVPSEAPKQISNSTLAQVFPAAGQEINKVFHRGIRCHNCTQEGHYSTICPRPRVSYKQREAKKARIEEEEGNGGVRGPSTDKSVATAQ